MSPRHLPYDQLTHEDLADLFERHIEVTGTRLLVGGEKHRVREKLQTVSVGIEEQVDPTPEPNDLSFDLTLSRPGPGARDIFDRHLDLQPFLITERQLLLTLDGAETCSAGPLPLQNSARTGVRSP